MAANDPLPRFDGSSPELEVAFTKVVCQLGVCPECRIKYAVVPDSRFLPGAQHHFYSYTDVLMYAHICSGGYLCLRGHELNIKPGLYVYLLNGKWLKASPQVGVRYGDGR